MTTSQRAKQVVFVWPAIGEAVQWAQRPDWDTGVMLGVVDDFPFRGSFVLDDWHPALVEAMESDPLDIPSGWRLATAADLASLGPGQDAWNDDDDSGVSGR